MPNSPKTSFPNWRATTILANNASPRDMTVPASAQNIPLARRTPIGEALTRATQGFNGLGHSAVAVAPSVITLGDPARERRGCGGSPGHHHRDSGLLPSSPAPRHRSAGLRPLAESDRPP